MIQDLQLEYVDLYLVHWPFSQKPENENYGQDLEEVPYIDTWREMEVNNILLYINKNM